MLGELLILVILVFIYKIVRSYGVFRKYIEEKVFFMFRFPTRHLSNFFSKVLGIVSSPVTRRQSFFKWFSPFLDRY